MTAAWPVDAAEIARLPTPPMLPGPPLLGHALDFRRDALGVFRRGYERFGPVFGIRLALQPAVVLVGPEYNRFFFEKTDTLLSMAEVYRFLDPIIGDRVAFTASPEEYLEQRRVMQPAFQGRKLKLYLDEMMNETTEWLDTLGPRGELDLVAAAERLTLAVVARAVLGADFRRRLGGELTRELDALSRGLEFVLPTNLPLPRFIRRDRAQRRLRAMFGEVVRARRAAQEQPDDFLEALLASSYHGAPTIPDEKIVTFILGLLFGGRENTAGHLEWSLVQILQHPAVLERAVEESARVFGDGRRPDLDAIRGMTWLDACMKETERTRPVTHTLLRLNKDDYVAGGYRVPKGWLTVAGIALTQRLPELFRDPARYDPTRFSPERAEDRPWSIVGFGGARHACWAKAFVGLELKVIIGMWLARYDLSLVDPDVRGATNDIGVIRPARPCRLRYERRA